MSGLHHNFLLLSRKDHPFGEYCKHFKNPDSLKIHDDLLQYIKDTLEWIPTYNPAMKIACQGLCWYGPTIIKEEGAKLTKDIFKSWSELFNKGPITLNLKGQYSFEIENDPTKDGFEKIKPNSGRYDRLSFDRDIITETFNKIVFYADQIIKSNEDLYILHLGI